MDKSTAGGLGGGWALVALAIILGGVGFGPYIDVPSVIIVIGGTIAVTAGQFEASDLKRVTPAIKVAFNEVTVEPLPELVEKITFYATEILIVWLPMSICGNKSTFFRMQYAAKKILFGNSIFFERDLLYKVFFSNSWVNFYFIINCLNKVVK